MFTQRYGDMPNTNRKRLNGAKKSGFDRDFFQITPTQKKDAASNRHRSAPSSSHERGYSITTYLCLSLLASLLLMYFSHTSGTKTFMSDLFTHRNARSLRRRRHRPSRHRLMKEEVQRSIRAWENRKDKRMAAYRGEDDFHAHEIAFAKGLHKPTFDDGEENVEELEREDAWADTDADKEMLSHEQRKIEIRSFVQRHRESALLDHASNHHHGFKEMEKNVKKPWQYRQKEVEIKTVAFGESEQKHATKSERRKEAQGEDAPRETNNVEHDPEHTEESAVNEYFPVVDKHAPAKHTEASTMDTLRSPHSTNEEEDADEDADADTNRNDGQGSARFAQPIPNMALIEPSDVDTIDYEDPEWQWKNRPSQRKTKKLENWDVEYSGKDHLPSTPLSTNSTTISLPQAAKRGTDGALRWVLNPTSPSQDGATTLITSTSPSQDGATTLITSTSPSQGGATTLITSTSPSQDGAPTLMTSAKPSKNSAPSLVRTSTHRAWSPIPVEADTIGPTFTEHVDPGNAMTGGLFSSTGWSSTTSSSTGVAMEGMDAGESMPTRKPETLAERVRRQHFARELLPPLAERMRIEASRVENLPMERPKKEKVHRPQPICSIDSVHDTHGIYCITSACEEECTGLYGGKLVLESLGPPEMGQPVLAPRRANAVPANFQTQTPAEEMDMMQNEEMPAYYEKRILQGRNAAIARQSKLRLREELRRDTERSKRTSIVRL